ncbi:hypothetical protein CM15mP35_10020 [bacterium]|nr:MAG: hypothetical protein CM15mP35_10020 [bacterium]
MVYGYWDPFFLKTNSPENNKFIYFYLNKFMKENFTKEPLKIIFTHNEVAELHQTKFKIDQSKIVIGYPVSLVNEEYVKIHRTLTIKLNH